MSAITENVPGVVLQFYASNTVETGAHYTSPKLFEIFGLEFIVDPSLFLPSRLDSVHEVIEKQTAWKWKLKDGIYSFCQVKDSGHGIRPEKNSQIFEPFYTTRIIGRGLGLALTVGIMQAHNGAITVESSHNKGTTVRVLLPSISSTQQARPLSDGVRIEPVQLSGNILLAEDDLLVQIAFKTMLERLGFTVHTATNGQVAVNMVRKQDIDFCVVVLDISMPEMDGIEAMFDNLVDANRNCRIIRPSINHII